MASEEGPGQGREKSGLEWSALRSLLPYLWPPGDWGLRARVVVAMLFLAAAKATNVYVPVLYRGAVDALGGERATVVVLPIALIVGYGAEAAYADTEEKMKTFEASYRALIGELEKTGATIILMTPIHQYRHGKVIDDPSERNKRLDQAAKFILALAKERGHQGIHLKPSFLIGGDFTARESNPFLENGVHLNDRGYRGLARYLALELGVQSPSDWMRVIWKFPMHRAGRGRQENTEHTKRGVRYDFTRRQLPPLCHDDVVPTTWKDAPRVWIDGVEVVQEDQEQLIRSGPDFDQAEQLRQVIIEKNKLHRYKLNPINKAYIFLFRRHEMGHLAYELEDFDELIKGREQAIAKLRVPRTHRYEIEWPQEWKSPRNYPDHEVPKDIPAPDVVKELKAFKVAEGFQVNLFAKNPMIFNPINLNWDNRGRAWVATSSTYPHIKPGRIPNDRIVILEDTDRDGVADKSTVFAEGLTVPHSVMPVKGGAYVCSTTEVLFLADHDGDDVADEKRVIFSGFGNADVHHMIHGLRWSPWGDLFFTQSIYINSFVETAHGPRRLNGSGIWRFRPETEGLEVFARGMVNPWGLAFDHWGRGFGTDWAGGSGPHDVFPGSAFGTAVGAPRVLGGLIPGKPKNTAAEFMSGRHIPTHWQGSMLANDFRANRTVRYQLEENGSGFKAKEVETVLHSSHRSFRPVDIKMGPDGAIYVVDWYNPIIDHGEVDFHHPLRDKSHGRIWRLTVRDRELVEHPEIAEATIGELLHHLKAPEQYTRTQANRELVERGISAAVVDGMVGHLQADDPSFDHHRLEALWLSTALNHTPADGLLQLLTVADPRIRAAAVRTVGRTTAGLTQLAIAVEDEHPRVRLEAVSALRRLGTKEAADLALRALDYEVDTNLDFALEMTVRDTRDQWLPAMQAGKTVFGGKANRLSYALSKVNDPRAIEALAEVINSGTLKGDDLGNALSTIASLGTPAQVGKLLDLAENNPRWLSSIARGAVFNQVAPESKEKVVPFLKSEEAMVRMAAATLCGAWKLTGAEKELIRGAIAAKASSEVLAMTTALARIGAMDALARLSDAGNPVELRALAIAAWAGVNPEKTATSAAKILRGLKDASVAALVFKAFLGREEGPAALAKALAGNSLPKPIAVAGSKTVSISGRHVPQLIAALNKAGGLKPISQALSADERGVLLADARKKGDPAQGQKIYERAAMACTTCHLVNGKGGKLGPDLSTLGAYMTPESILESVLNPSTDVKQGYETVLVTRKDQTLVSGLLQRKTDTAVLVRDPSGSVVSIPTGEVAKIDTSPVSLMPPGLTATLRRDELVDLMSYLTTLGK